MTQPLGMPRVLQYTTVRWTGRTTGRRAIQPFGTPTVLQYTTALAGPGLRVIPATPRIPARTSPAHEEPMKRSITFLPKVIASEGEVHAFHILGQRPASIPSPRVIVATHAITGR